jgi:RNase P subunit RPR2
MKRFICQECRTATWQEPNYAIRSGEYTTEYCHACHRYVLMLVDEGEEE